MSINFYSRSIADAAKGCLSIILEELFCAIVHVRGKSSIGFCDSWWGEHGVDMLKPSKWSESLKGIKAYRKQGSQAVLSEKFHFIVC
ncbi:hypothetical protein [Bartonella gabonensis]|uniref:hypothetical protein n=1 Tax=Bartonella gabonensis TaxID=2699889 RepID=UPI00158BD971|nr:hypothetical protein [Bartonella gabonensis]